MKEGRKNFISTSEERNENRFSFHPSEVETKGLMPRRAQLGPAELSSAPRLKPFIVLILVLIFFGVGVFGLSGISHGQEYVLLEPIGGIQTVPTGPGGAGAYLKTIFQLAIGIAGVLAVLMIVIGGIQYMTSEAFTSKEEAKKRIGAAIGGLILAFASILILNTINPDLLKLDFIGTPRETSQQRQIPEREIRIPQENIETSRKNCELLGGEFKEGRCVKKDEVQARELSIPPENIETSKRNCELAGFDFREGKCVSTP